MTVVGVFYHPHKEEAQPLAEEVVRWLAARDAEGWAAPVRDGPAETAAVAERVAQSSLLVVLGGDGSTLRVARMAAPHGAPIFGINLGRVGFLSEAAPDNWQPRLEQVLAGDCWVERRLMLAGALERDGRAVAHFKALNDIVVGRGAEARVLRLRLYVDDHLVTTYTADALIVATPTGSTAYAMAVGGPLLPPQLQNYLVVPVAPHLSLDRAVILHEQARVAVEVQVAHDAAAAADGQSAVPLQNGDRIVVTRHPDRACFARIGGPSYFYHRLMERLGYWHRQ